MMSFLVDKILLAPVDGLLFIAKAVHERVQEEAFADTAQLHDKLLQLQWEYHRGEISETEFREQETALAERLLAAGVNG